MRRLSPLLLLTMLLIACSSNLQDSLPTVVTQSPTDTPLVAPTNPLTPTELPLPTATVPLTATPKPTPTMEVILKQFDGERAFADIEAQVALGPRFPGSDGHLAVREFMVESLEAEGWAVERQTFEYFGLEGMNVIARANVGKGNIALFGAHYDTRAISDQSPGQEDVPGVGAVDGASGVAVLLEMARSLNLEQIDREIWLAFFDLEDNGSGGIQGWQWIVGSTYMANHLTEIPAHMILVDMIGDADQQLYYEGNSNVALREEIWAIAAELGYDSFIPELKYTMIDDHVPFVQQGIPSIDIIDFDYPYWHTVEDTPDKASAESLQRVGDVLQVWLEGHNQ